MTDYQATESLEQIAERLENASGPVLLMTHAKPDGDAWGSVVALAAALRQVGIAASGLLVPPVPEAFQALDGQDLLTCWHEGMPLPEATLYLLLDTGAWSQVGPLKHALATRTDRLLILDHHLSGDVPALARYVDGQAAACCEIMAELIDVLARRTGWQRGENPLFSSRVCEALFVGIASDTGWFKFSNTRAATHTLAARLHQQGVDHAELYRRLEQCERPEKLALLRRSLDSLQLLADGRAAIMLLRASDFEATGARVEETERLIDLPQQVASIQLIVLVTEVAIGQGQDRRLLTRLSFRSKPAGPLNPVPVNVAVLASQFGGGGHARAAGAKCTDKLEVVLPQVIQAVEEAAASSIPIPHSACP